jgi:multidrug efflux pump subunit AcrA (membrane-fusion protein)
MDGSKPGRAPKRKWIGGLVIAAVALLGVSAFAALMLTRSHLGRRPRRTVAPLVNVVAARPVDVPVVIRSMGGVRAAREVQLVPQVSGKVVQISRHLIPGGRVRRGEVLVRIDRADYDLAVRAARAAVTEAQLALDVQRGHRAVAKTELKLLKGKAKLSPEGMRLASRESHVENARVQLDAARSRLEQAELALQRTVLRAPFDARVSDKKVDVGQVVSTQSVLASLVASDEVWIEATLPVEQLRWIDVPGPRSGAGAAVVVRQKLGGSLETVRRGQVLGLLPGLLEQGKLARVLVRVRDPFGPASPTPRPEGAREDLPLLVGSFVHLEIQGHTLAGLFPLPRGALRENNKVWVCSAEGTLEYRSVAVVWSRGETVYLRGELSSGDRVISSRLTTPLPGMRITPVDDETSRRRAAIDARRSGADKDTPRPGPSAP